MAVAIATGAIAASLVCCCAGPPITSPKEPQGATWATVPQGYASKSVSVGGGYISTTPSVTSLKNASINLRPEEIATELAQKENVRDHAFNPQLASAAAFRPAAVTAEGDAIAGAEMDAGASAAADDEER